MRAVGVVCLGPLLGRSATAPPHQQRLLLSAMILLDAIAGLWILVQYAFEVILVYLRCQFCALGQLPDLMHDDKFQSSSTTCFPRCEHLESLFKTRLYAPHTLPPVDSARVGGLAEADVRQ